ICAMPLPKRAGMPASPERGALLLVSISARALASSAARQGLPAVALDVFNDLDTRAYAVASRAVAGRDGRLDAKRLLAAASALCPPANCMGLVYGSGFEGRTRLLARLASGRTLYGNTPATVASVKDPGRFFPLLDRLAIAHPEVRFELPANSAGWLLKRIGAAGGSHVRRARPRQRAGAHRYFQRFQPGRTLSALFAADGRQARIIGYHEQWTADVPQCAPFCYGGAVSQPPLGEKIARVMSDQIERLVRATALIGLNGADFIIDGNAPLLLEVNPRPTATIDLYDADVDGGMLGVHLRACRGELPPEPTRRAARAHAIVYAADALRVPANRSWPDWCTDLPAGGSFIQAGAPVCSVHARANTSADAFALAQSRRREIEMSLWKEAA
ncbi:MAG: ATP-grasp domain-containing protein, partial [Burkholderiales bacterium]